MIAELARRPASSRRICPGLSNGFFSKRARQDLGSQVDEVCVLEPANARLLFVDRAIECRPFLHPCVG
jgi:hypothetical protein